MSLFQNRRYKNFANAGDSCHNMRSDKRHSEEDFDETQCFRIQLALGGAVFAVLLWVLYCLLTFLLRPEKGID